jgi:WD40 repeat protein
MSTARHSASRDRTLGGARARAAPAFRACAAFVLTLSLVSATPAIVRADNNTPKNESKQPVAKPGPATKDGAKKDGDKKDADKKGDAAQTIPIAQLKRDAPVDFAKEIAPIFKKHCLACHNATKHEGSLVLETPQSMLKGGDSGPAVVAKVSGESLLLDRATGKVDPRMPPEDNNVAAKPLSSEELGLLKLWIDQGAAGAAAVAEAIQWQPLPAGVNPIYAVALSPDGQFAACGRANQVFIYHVPSRRFVCRLTDPELMKSGVYKKPGVAGLDLVQSLAFSPDGYTLASGGYRIVKLWSRPHDVRQFTFDAIAPESVPAVATTADGRWLATGGSDGQIKLFDLSSGQAARTLSGHTAAVTSLKFSADGAKLFSTSLDKSIRAWQVADGAPAGQIDAPAAQNALAIVGDGSQLATGGADKVIRIWAVPQPGAPAAAAAVRELAGHTEAVTSLATVPSAPTQIVSGSLDKSVRVWNTVDGKMLRNIFHGGPVAAVAVRPDGTRIASAGLNNIAKLWKTADGRLVTAITGNIRDELQVAAKDREVSGRKADNGYLASAVTAAEKASAAEAEGVKKATEGQAAAAKALAEKVEPARKAAEAKVAADKAAADTAAAAKAADEAKAAALKALAAADATAKTTAAMAAQAKTAADAAAGNKFLADAKAAGEKAVAETTAVLNAAKTAKASADKVAAEFPAKVKATAAAAAAATKAATDAEAARKQAEVAKTAADQALAAANAAAKRAADLVPAAKKAVAAGEGRLKQAQAELEAAKKASVAGQQPIRTLAFSPDNLQLAVAGDDGIVHTYNAESGAAFETYSRHDAPVLAVAFAGADKLVSAGADKRAVVWDLKPAWGLQRTIGGAESAALVDRVTALCFSADGKLLATGGGEPSRSGELKLWNPADGTLVREIVDAHSDTIFGLDFSPDGKYIASCGADKFVKVFDVTTGSLVRTFEGHTHHVLAVSWRADGRVLASGGADNVIKVWNFETGEQQRTISGFNKEVTSLAFVGTSPMAVSCSGDKSVHLHKTDDGRNVRTFAGGGDFMYSAAVTPDGKLLVAGGQDSTLRAWSGDDGKSLATFAPPKP